MVAPGVVSLPRGLLAPRSTCRARNCRAEAAALLATGRGQPKAGARLGDGQSLKRPAALSALPLNWPAAEPGAGLDTTPGTIHDPRRLAGVATTQDVRAVASTKALLARGRTLRPSLDRPEPSDVGYLLGRSQGQDVWASVEDSILLLGPPRSGKGLHVVINSILDAPGAAITTATRPDNIAATLTGRQRRGPVAVFDPQRLAEGLPSGLRWSPVRGCEDPLTAMIRATGLASATGLSTGGVESGGFWEGKNRASGAAARRCPRQPRPR